MTRSPRWTFSDLAEELRQDPKRKILFVEGKRDIIFWKRIVPILDRISTVVYSANEVDIPENNDGNKGRLISLARKLLDAGLQDRVKVFVDADYDRIFRATFPPNVVLTDFRDLESYANCEEILEFIFCDCFGKSSDAVAVARQSIDEACRPIATSRIWSLLNKKKLPFQATLLNNGYEKYCRIRSGKIESFNTRRLLNALCANSMPPIHNVDEILEIVEGAIMLTSNIDSRDFVHGKDFVSVLALLLSLEEEAATAQVFSALFANPGAYMGNENISGMESWLRSA